MRKLLLAGLAGLLVISLLNVQPAGRAWSAPQHLSTGTGLLAQYFDNLDLSHLKLTRTDAGLNFDWGAGSPDAALAPESFSVRWLGYVQPLFSETYTFYVNVDDGARLWLNGKLLIDGWTDRAAAQELSARAPLTAGALYELRLEVYENAGNAAAGLSWSSPSQPKQIIPTAQLYPAAPQVTDPAAAIPSLYLLYEENFDTVHDWAAPFQLTASASGGLATLTRTSVDVWGKLERTQNSLIPVDLSRAPVLRIKVDSVSSSAVTWKLVLFKTSPVWSGALELQPPTNATGVYDYNLPMMTGWNGPERLQLGVYIDGAAGEWVKLDYVYFGSYTDPTPPAPVPAPRLIPVIDYTNPGGNTIQFDASRSRIENSNLPIASYEWNFGDGATGSGPAPSHTYPDNQVYTALLTITDSAGNKGYAVKDVRDDAQHMYADFFVGYHSRAYSGRSDLWWWYETPDYAWSKRPGDLYAPGSTQTKQTISYYTPLIGYYDQWDPASAEYAILLSKVAGLDGFAFEHQYPGDKARDLMNVYLPYAQQYDFKLTAHWITAGLYSFQPDKYTTRTQVLEDGKRDMADLLRNIITPSNATYTVGGVKRPVWIFFDWNKEQSLPGLPPIGGPVFSFTKDEVNALRAHVTAVNGGVDPLFIADGNLLSGGWTLPDGVTPCQFTPDGHILNAAWSDCHFTVADVFDGMVQWITPRLEPIPASSPHYLPGYPANSQWMGTVARNLELLQHQYNEQTYQVGLGNLTVRGGSAFPGFDDRYNAAWGAGERRLVPASDANGSTLAQELDKLIQNSTQIGLFGTFADWAESTTFEPTVELGYSRAETLAQKIAQWKGLASPDNALLRIPADIYALRQRHNALQMVGYTPAQLKALSDKIDLIIPPLLTRNLAGAQSALAAAQAEATALENAALKHTLSYEWADPAQGATPTAGAWPLAAAGAVGQQAFTLPESARTLLQSGGYAGSLSFEYQDNGAAWLAAGVNNHDANFRLNVDEASDILKVQKTNSGAWRTATADFVAADFTPRFADRPDLVFESQGSMAFVDNFSHSPNALSVAVWVKNDSLAARPQNYVSLIDTATGQQVFVLQHNGYYNGSSTPGLLQASLNLSGTLHSLTLPGALTTGAWTHLAVTWDGATQKIYVNGAEQASAGQPGVLSAATDQILIGAFKGGLDGLIDDLQVYSRALTPGEVSTVYGGQAASAPVAGRWKFEEGSGVRVADDSGNNHPAAFYNAPQWADDVPPTAGNTRSARFVSDAAFPQVRRVTLQLQASLAPAIVPPNFTPAFVEDFSNVSDWAPTDLNTSLSGGVATLTVAPGKPWGKLDSRNTAFAYVDLDQNPILRVTVTEAAAMWKIAVQDTAAWQLLDLRYLTNETGTFDIDLTQATSLTGRRRLSFQLIVDSGGNPATNYVKFEALEIGHTNDLAIPTFAFVEDFADTGDWAAWQGALTPNGQTASLRVAAGQTWAKMERQYPNPNNLVSVNLDQHPLLRVDIAATDGAWRLFVLDANSWATHELQPSTTQVGAFTYDVAALTGWAGVRTLQVQLIVEGTGKTLTVDELKFRSPYPPGWYIGYEDAMKDAGNWQVDPNSGLPGQPPTLSFDPNAPHTATLSVPNGGWGAMLRPEPGRLVTVDLNTYPYLEVQVAAVSPGGRWQVQVFRAGTADSFTIPYSNFVGLKSVRVPAGWAGVTTLQIKIFVDDNDGQRTAPESVTFDALRFKRPPGTQVHFTVPYHPREQSHYSGAASLKMVLDYQGSNAYTQTQLHQYAVSQNSAPNAGASHIDPNGMYLALNHFELQANYNYQALVRNTLNDACHTIAYWLAYQVPQTNPNRMPAAIPLGGNYAGWVVVNGFSASDNPLIANNYTVHGFWITDPNAAGIGQNVYRTAASLGQSYLPISSADAWNGKYVTVSEPPAHPAQVTVAEPQAPQGRPATRQALVAAALQSLQAQGLGDDMSLQAALAGARAGKPMLVHSERGDYFIVPFVKNGGVSVAVLLDAHTGAFRAVTYSPAPDTRYLKQLERATRLKAGEVFGGKRLKGRFSHPLNEFLPAVNQVVVLDG